MALAYFALIFCFVGKTISTCPRPYVDLCGNDEFTNIEVKSDNEANICNCEQVMFCSLIELTEECSSATVVLNSNGNLTLSNQLKCDVRNLDLQVDTLPYQITNKSENITVRIFTEFNFGKYKVVCDVTEIPNEFISPNYTGLDITDIKPKEVSLDSTVELRVTITRQPGGSSVPIWCFVRTPDKDIEILSTIWTSEVEISCLGFSAATPGIFFISIGPTLTSNNFEKYKNVTVTSKHPVPQQAEYSSDFQKIFIHFDGNIELKYTCASAFPENSLECFGTNFRCYIRGNVLVVRMGHGFEIIDNITISSDNKIYRAGCQGPEFCLSSRSVELHIIKPKISGPNLSLYMDSPCKLDSATQQMSLVVTPSRQVNSTPQNKTTRPLSPGKRQRKNLINWRAMRQVQSRLTPQHIVVHSNETEVPEDLVSLVKDLDVDDDTLGSAASVYVSVQSSPTVVLAEANVAFCEGLVKPFLYKWIVNGKDVSQDGKLLVLRDLPPGKHIIKCMIIDADTAEALGQGWATTEFLSAEEKVIITPSETTAGESDDVFLRAVTWHGGPVSWTCRTTSDKLCLTTDNKSVNDVIDLNSSNIFIPRGTFPAGEYVWKVENAEGLNKATIFIKNGRVPAVKTENPVFVKPAVVLQGTVERVEDECTTWWSSVRQNGFSYFHFNEMEKAPEKENNSTREVPLAIPSKTTDPDSFYLFQLHVFCPQTRTNQKGSYDYLKIPVVVSEPPRISPLHIQPLAGVAMATTFTVSGAEAESPFDDHPLLYEWNYIDPCDKKVPIKRGAFSKTFTTYLPPGDIKLLVRVCNGRKICSEASTPIINVIQGSEIVADNFHNAKTEIERLLTSGDTLEGFGLSVTVFKSLALLAETKIREEMFSTVKKGIINRIEVLTKGIKTGDRKTIESGLEFFEQAVEVGKYFRKGSDISKSLTEFRENVLERNSSY